MAESTKVFSPPIDRVVNLLGFGNNVCVLKRSLNRSFDSLLALKGRERKNRNFHASLYFIYLLALDLLVFASLSYTIYIFSSFSFPSCWNVAVRPMSSVVGCMQEGKARMSCAREPSSGNREFPSFAHFSLPYHTLCGCSLIDTFRNQWRKNEMSGERQQMMTRAIEFASSSSWCDIDSLSRLLVTNIALVMREQFNQWEWGEVQESDETYHFGLSPFNPWKRHYTALLMNDWWKLKWNSIDPSSVLLWEWKFIFPRTKYTFSLSRDIAWMGREQKKIEESNF